MYTNLFSVYVEPRCEPGRVMHIYIYVSEKLSQNQLKISLSRKIKNIGT